jgi:alkyl sulfatase BDS1-like metallo-beta-lactamase superfamily hydrolase
MVEAGEMVELPGALAQDFSLRGHYGTMNHNVKSAFVKHFGWFNGNAATLHPLSRTPRSTTRSRAGTSPWREASRSSTNSCQSSIRSMPGTTS